MPTRKIQFDPFATDRLRKALSDKIGYVITNKPDCAKLSDILVQEGFSYLSESTIYRMFFQPDRHSPYKNTLDVLCRFVGFRDSPDFLESLQPEREMLHLNGINTLGGPSNSLFYYCIETRSAKPLADFFEHLQDAPVAFKESIGISLFDSLLKNTRPEWFFRSFAGQPFVREFFMELGHDPKFRIRHYDRAYAHYLEGVDAASDLKQFRDFVFGHCVLFRHHFLQKRPEKALAIGSALYGGSTDVEALRGGAYIFPYIRFKAYWLWYLQLTGATANELAEYALFLLDLCGKLRPELSRTERKILFHTMAETLLHASLPDSWHDALKTLFRDEYRLLPEAVFSKHLQYSLPYFDMNGLLSHRP